eukprot:1796174-Prymnesium_polylepis.2
MELDRRAPCTVSARCGVGSFERPCKEGVGLQCQTAARDGCMRTCDCTHGPWTWPQGPRSERSAPMRGWLSSGRVCAGIGRGRYAGIGRGHEMHESDAGGAVGARSVRFCCIASRPYPASRGSLSTLAYAACTRVRCLVLTARPGRRPRSQPSLRPPRRRAMAYV